VVKPPPSLRAFTFATSGASSWPYRQRSTSWPLGHSSREVDAADQIAVGKGIIVDRRRLFVGLLLRRRLLATLGIGASFDVGNFPTILHVGSHLADRLVVDDLGGVGDRPVAILRLRLEQLGDQFALLLGSEMPTVNVEDSASA
jgi:hypothetical protein